MRRRIFIGFEPRETAAFLVARNSVARYLNTPTPIYGISLAECRAHGLYSRPTEIRDGRLWDAISAAPMATEFAISRFLVPALAGTEGWAMFMDCDMLVRANLDRLFERLQQDRSKAVYVVKHDHRPASAVKMDGQIQTVYPRKNWSSVMVFNLSHPANAALTVEMVNTLPGRDLHRFCWLGDDDIGELGVEWNWLVGHSPAEVSPNIVHFTDGIPLMQGYERAAYADEWWSYLNGFGGAGSLWLTRQAEQRRAAG